MAVYCFFFHCISIWLSFTEFYRVLPSLSSYFWQFFWWFSGWLATREIPRFKKKKRQKKRKKNPKNNKKKRRKAKKREKRLAAAAANERRAIDDADAPLISAANHWPQWPTNQIIHCRPTTTTATTATTTTTKRRQGMVNLFLEQR